MIQSESLSALLEFAVDLAWHAGRLTLGWFQTGMAVEWKQDASPVTTADRNAERWLRDRIEQHFPGDGIVGEELGELRPTAPRRWILDPIDGTRSFIRGVPLYGTLVALEIERQPVIGVIHLPALDETVCAALGQGCWWNGRRARVSATSQLRDALVLTTSVRGLERGRHAAAWDRLCTQVQTTRTWGDCYGYSLVATGRAEAMIDGTLSIWDAAPMFPILLEAGGVVTDLAGRPRHDGGSLVATNGALADTIRAILEEPA